MTHEEYKKISEALEEARERIERSFDYLIDDLKKYDQE